MRSREIGEAEVVADVGDDVGDRSGVDVVFEVGGVETDEEFVVENFGLGAAGLALDLVFDLTDDALAGEEPILDGVGGWRWDGLGEFAGQGNGAADGAGDAVEGDGEVGEGGFGGGGGAAFGWFGLSLGFGVLVEQAGEVGADFDELVQDAAVVFPVLRKGVGRGFGFG